MSSQILPSYVTKYFWGDDLSSLSLQKHKKYIIQTILEKGDEDALRWLFSMFDKQMIRNQLSSLRLSKKSEYFWNMYLS